MPEFSYYPAAPVADVAFLGDAIDSRFIRDGDIIERGGACITVISTSRFDDENMTAFTYYNESGGIQVATVQHGIMVPLGTLIQ